jgi:hypothetical protein
MAVIPSAESIGVRQITTDKSVTRPDVSYAGKASGVQAGLLEEMYEKQTREELAKAKMDFQVMKAQHDVGYDDDDDEDTIEERYNVGVMTGLGKAAENITDSNMRSAFVQEGQTAVELGKLRMRELAHKKRGDKQIAYLSNATDTVLKGAIAGGDLSNAHFAIESMWRSLQEQGHVSAVDAETSIRKAKYEMALGKLKTMAPREQLEALKSEWVKELPADVITKLRNEALDAELDDKALSIANEWNLEGISVDEANDRLDEFTNADEYDKVRNRFLQMKNDNEIGTQENQQELYTSHFADVALGRKKVIDIDDIEKYKMSPAQLSNLQAAEERATKKTAGEYVPTYSDPETKARLVQARKYFSEGFARLNDTDFKYFESQVDGDRASDPVTRGLRTANQQMTILLEANKMKNDTVVENKIWNSVTDRYNQFVEDNDKRPDGEVVNSWLKDEFIKIRRDPDAIFMDDDVYVHDMPPAEREEFFEAVDKLRQRYPDITRDQIVTQYENMMRARQQREP